MPRSLRLLIDQAAQRRRQNMRGRADGFSAVGMAAAGTDVLAPGARVIDLESGEVGEVIDVQRIDVEGPATEP